MVQMNIGLNHGLVTTHNKQRNTARVKMIETDFGSYEIQMKPHVDTRLTKQ